MMTQKIIKMTNYYAPKNNLNDQSITRYKDCHRLYEDDLGNSDGDWNGSCLYSFCQSQRHESRSLQVQTAQRRREEQLQHQSWPVYQQQPHRIEHRQLAILFNLITLTSYEYLFILSISCSRLRVVLSKMLHKWKIK